MSKNTGTSELINYFDLGVNGDVGIAGSLDINTIANATTDTDTFLVSDTGIIKYRTGTQLLSDIGAQAAGNYVTTDTSQAITANKSFTVGFSLGSEGSGNQTSFFRNTSSLFSGSGGTNIFGFNNSNNIYFGKGLNNGGVLQWNNTTATRYYTLPDADGTLALTSQIPANPVGGTGAFGRVAYWNAAGTITSDSLFQWNDTFRRLGIGCTPTVSLDVVGAGVFTSSVTARNGSSGTAFITTNAVNADFTIETTSGGLTRIGTSGNNLAINSGGGNVGIGTTTITNERLTVAHTTANASALLVYTTGLAAGQSYGATIIGGTNSSDASFRVFNQGAGTNYFTVRGDGNVGIGTPSPTSKLEIQNSPANDWGISVWGNTTTGQSYGGIVRGGTNSNDVAFRVNNAANSSTYFTVQGNGNVGIGTPTPTSGKLVVSDASSTKIYIAGGSSQNGMTWEAVGGAHSFYLFNGTISSAGWGIYNVNTGTFPFFATNGGNVLIGTTTVDSGQKLQVNGTAATSGNLTSATLLVRNASNSQTIVGIGNRSWWTGGASDNDAAIGTYSPNMCFFTNNSGTERMRINSSGDLVVTGTVANISILGDGAQMHFGRNNTNYIIANGGTSSTIRIISNTNGVELSNGATSWVAVSDENLKEMSEWKPFENSVEKILSLRAGTSRYKTDKEGTSRSFLIAQDVKYILPEAVSEYEDGTLGLRYTEVIPMLVAAIQEQQVQIDKLKNS